MSGSADRSGSRPRPWELGRLIPGILVVAILADFAFRSMSLSNLAFRAWEVLWVGAGPTSGPFLPNAHYQNSESYGELASVGNLPSLRVLHAETFTTDAFGYRNASVAGPFDAVLLGTSFSVGSGVSDDDTLSVQLSQQTGRRVYNAAGPGYSRERFQAFAGPLGINHGTVIFEVLERRQFGDPTQVKPAEDPVSAIIGAVRERLLAFRVSPLKIIVQRGWKLLLDDRLLPNSLAERVVVRTLQDGTRMIFRAEDFDAERSRQDPAPAVRYLEWLKGDLAEQGLDLLVVLVPEKASVYGPLVTEQPPPTGAAYFEALESALRAHGFRVENLLPPLQAEARGGLPQHRFVYFPDDTHWNAIGIEVAAHQLSRRMALDSP